MSLHHRAVFAVKPHELGQRRKPDVPSNVEPFLAISDNLEVMNVLLAIEEGENHCTGLAAALSYQVCPRSIDSL
jgi:hypothetical protein